MGEFTQSCVVRRSPLILAGAYAVLLIVGRGTGSPWQVAGLAAGYATAIGGVFLLLAGFVLLTRLVRADRDNSPASVAQVVRDALARRWAEDRALSVWQPLAVFVLVMTAFTLFKQTVLPTAGFGMGPAIADADRALFGVDPWRITHRLAPSAWASQALDLAYHAWFAPMTLGVVLCAFARPGSVLATRYLLSYGLLWVLQGSLLAYWLPAAGPAFFMHFQAEAGRYAELMRTLAEQDAALRAAGAPGLSALMFQNYLLHLFGSHDIALGGGISAMPSLHNAMAILFVCAARHVSRRLSLAFAIYAVLIWIGSVHLGWHYALDGMMALGATLATWSLTGVICHLPRRFGQAPSGDRPVIAG